MKRLRTSIGGIVLAGLLGPVGLALPASGDQPPDGTPGTPGGAVGPSETSVAHDRIVSDDPADNTPHVLDGQVLAVAEAGDTIVLGGRFSQVSNPDGSQVHDRANLVAFDRRTGEIDPDFAPDIDSDVTSLAVAADGESVYVGGFFDTVDGQQTRSLARLRLADGQPDPDFATPTLNGRIKDLALVGERLWIAGAFTHVDGSRQPALATLNADTGAFDPYVRQEFSDPRNGGVRQVLKVAVTPDGRNLVAIGNFTAVDGESRYQAAMLNLTADDARLANWRTDFFTTRCSSSFDTYMRDVDISPDGEYFVVVTAGSYWGGPPAACDTASRFEVEPGGDVGDGTEVPEAEPTWVAYTGGDTNLSVAVTGAAVYTGGHFRWQNNPYGGDEPGRGAVSREGVAALDPSNGAPLTWNPTRTLGIGTSDILATESGLWTASDTDRLGGEYHGRIGFFPLEGGSQVPVADPGDLPGDVYTRASDGADEMVRQHVTGLTDPADLGERQSAPGTTAPWSEVGGAFMLSGQLHVALADGTFAQLEFDGDSAGEPVPIDAADQLVPDSAWHNDVDSITGAFYHHGRIYYTIRGDKRLFYRAYALQSGVVGAERKVAAEYVAGLELWRAGGMMLVGAPDGPDGAGTLVVGNEGDGNLRTVDFVDGRPSGEATVLSGPEVDGLVWESGPLFLYAEGAARPSFVAAESANSNAEVHRVDVPTSVRDGDRLLLFLTVNAADRTIGDPTGVSGWTEVGTEATRGSVTRVWTRKAGAGAAGERVSVPLSETTKGALTMVGYRSTDRTDGATVGVRAWASAAEDTSGTAHRTPTVGGLPGTVLVSYWGEKSSGTTAWTLPDGQELRAQSYGSGGGRVSSLLAEDPGAGSGTVGGVVAEADVASAQATMWSLLLG